MGNINRGKDFEREVRAAFECCSNISVDRLPDPTSGFLGMRNISDFLIYKYPFQLYLECKSTHGNTLNFKRITENQWVGLVEKSKIAGVIAGVLVWYVDNDLTTFVPISELQQLRDAGSPSLHKNSIIENKVNHFVLPGRKRKVLWDYNAEPFLDALWKWKGGMYGKTIK